MYHYPVHRLAQSALAYIRKHNLMRPGDRLGVAVSGGADSVALLRILLELRDDLGLVLSVVHVNHSLRGEESDGDEQFVRELALRYDLPIFSARRDVKFHATEKKLSIEAAARAVRYQYFEELLQKDEFNKLATAHTLDDQAETVLLKLTRGTGTRGLAGIYPKIFLASPHEQQASTRALELAIVRPLLAVQRRELEEFLTQVKQAWREDSSNLALQHTRNRIRKEILPALSARVNPRVRQTLSEVADIARAEEDFWEQESLRHLRLIWSPLGQGGTLQGTHLDVLPLALRRRVVRAAAESLDLDLEFSHVDGILGLLEDGARSALPSGWSAKRRKGMIEFECSRPAPVLGYEYVLAVPGRVEIREADLVVEASLTLPKHADQRYNPDHLLYPRFGGALVVRNWRAGDRFWPPHTKEPRKIKELLQDRHITGDEKKRWPVIASGDEVVWVRGLGVRCDLQPHDGTGILITDELLAKDH